MAQTELHFESKTYKLHDGTEHTFGTYDDRRIELIIKELRAIHKREQSRPLGDNQLPYGSDEYLLEAIGNLEKAIDWPGDIEDSYGEPPITLDEMHTAAWHEHQEAHR
jgi:hypothetical protein